MTGVKYRVWDFQSYGCILQLASGGRYEYNMETSNTARRLVLVNKMDAIEYSYLPWL